ncbi:MAG: hypothetical protein OFPI_27920 [Osedax symbiont Rs2]|nr:MAG: hypothetical protein OFPI_27920 [Osedax symbiont Rs2]
MLRMIGTETKRKKIQLLIEQYIHQSKSQSNLIMILPHKKVSQL